MIRNLILLLAVRSGLAALPLPEGPLEPRSLPCAFTVQPPAVDGKLDDPAWTAAPFSEPFLDIRGASSPAPLWGTQVKMLWDKEFLYVGAWLEEPDLWASYARHDMVIYHENDFEVFLDPDGDAHDYYELEINALGTTWDLLLTRPYRDDGCAVDSWEIPGLKSAVALEGSLNDPSDRDRGWSVELAFPWSVLEETARRPAPPAPGDVWRINFSRVQWHREVVDGRYLKRRDPATGDSLPEENWVWSPQGLVAMHYPERWGRLVFLDAQGRRPEGPGEWAPDELAAQAWLYDGYYRWRNDDLATPGPLKPPAGWMACPPSATPAGAFHAEIRHSDGRRLAIDTHGRLARQAGESR